MIIQQVVDKAQHAIDRWKAGQIKEPTFELNAHFDFHSCGIEEVPREAILVSRLVVGRFIGIAPNTNNPVYEFDALVVKEVLSGIDPLQAIHRLTSV